MENIIDNNKLREITEILIIGENIGVIDFKEIRENAELYIKDKNFDINKLYSGMIEAIADIDDDTFFKFDYLNKLYFIYKKYNVNVTLRTW